MTSKKDYILIEFKGNEAEFSFDVSRLENLIVGLMGLEATVMQESGLDLSDLREVIDEMRTSDGMSVRPMERKDPTMIDPAP